MIPVSLTLQGLYSYQAAQTIQFEPLSAAGLFGIFGPVGCGKSTLLEAITFALYGKTDRLNISGDNRNYNMMNLRSDELFIEFIFEAGPENCLYRSVVKGRRNSKNFEEVKKLDRTVYRQDKEEWIPVPEDEPEKVIGLSYDNFKRTVIIPQGRFQEFLQLGNKERTQMMQELFGLSRYELSAKTGSLESKNRAVLERLEGQLLQLSGATPEAELQAKEEANQLQLAVEKAKTELAQLRVTHANLERLALLAAREGVLSERMAALKAEEPAIREREKRLSEYEDCRLHFRPLLQSREAGRKRGDRFRQDLATVSRQIEEITQKQTETTDALGKLQPDFELREQLISRANELELATEWSQLFANKTTLEGRISNGLSVVQGVLEDIGKNEGAIEELEKQQLSLKATLPDRTRLMAVKEGYEKAKLLAQAVEEATETLGLHQDEEVLFLKSLTEIIAQGPAEWNLTGDFSAALPNLPDRVKTLQEQLTSLFEATRRSHERIRIEIGEQKEKEQLAHYARDLKEGEPCPLCGSLHHPGLSDGTPPSGLDEGLQERLLSTEKEMEQLRTLSAHMAEREREALRLKERRIRMEEKVRERTDALASHRNTFSRGAWSTESELQNALELADSLEQTLSKNETLLQKHRTLLKELLTNKERYQEGVGKLQQDLTICKTRLESLERRFVVLKADEYRQAEPEKLREASLSLKSWVASLESAYTKLRGEMSELDTQKGVLQGKLEILEQTLIQEEETGKQLEQQLLDALSRSSYLSLEAIEAILLRPTNPEAEKEAIQHFVRLQSETGLQWDQLLAEKNGENYQKEEHEIVSARLHEKEEAMLQMNREAGELAHRLKNIESELLRRKKLESELTRISARAKNLLLLKELFRGSKFVNFVSSVYLQNLCHAANERFFRLTRQRLRLEMAVDNSFQVRDFLNGGKVRSVKTLSGGQIFQASLSLALALADNLRAMSANGRNFFFLDEGFGSLDKESFVQVFETLKSLRQENRMIGIISHLEEMQQEIDVYLRIENDEEKGSLIKGPW